MTWKVNEEAPSPERMEKEAHRARLQTPIDCIDLDQLL
jgi:hypothetical protein